MPEKPANKVPATFEELQKMFKPEHMAFMSEMLSEPGDTSKDEEASVTVPMKPVNLPNVPAGYGPAPFEPGAPLPQIEPIAAPGKHYAPVYGPGELASRDEQQPKST